MKRTQEIFEKIEGYLAKTLSQEERAAFEKELSINPELENEVEKHRILHQTLSDQDTLDFKEKLIKISKEIKEEEQIKSTNKSFFSYWKIAASIIVLLGIGAILWSTIEPGDKMTDLYLSYYVAYPVEDATRGGTKDDLDAIMTDYVKKNYDKVINALETSPLLSDKEQLRLYLGNSFLNNNQEEKAILQFQNIQADSRFYEDANWYLALTYLKLGEVKKIPPLLQEIIQYNGIYKNKASKLLDELMN
ncbi:hypothetical protein [Aquimarina sp. 2201CG5-10]|uniref:tetratricopeptide repeat protein n=1 Tax=Aquimarina callyspongiae TaxID=3098150 RepID=UPI002AB33383|nr:hypothetical protein [Aquimarina sp. 2201CG5-10]MDY8138477.1 hypothetical protein [Aquimarina sp. 2201CG5-10]